MAAVEPVSLKSSLNRLPLDVKASMRTRLACSSRGINLLSSDLVKKQAVVFLEGIVCTVMYSPLTSKVHFTASTIQAKDSRISPAKRSGNTRLKCVDTKPPLPRGMTRL